MIDVVQALTKLAKTTEPALVEKLYSRALEQAPWAIWGSFKHVRDEHADVALRVVGGSDASQLALLRAGHAQKGAAGLRAAGDYFAYAKTSTNLPGLLKRLKKDRAKFAPLLPAARQAVEANAASKEEPDILTFWGLVYLLAAADVADPLLEKVKAANEGWGDEYGVYARVMAAAKG